MGYSVVGVLAKDQCGSKVGIDITENQLTGFKGGNIPVSEEAANSLIEAHNKMIKNGVSLSLSESIEIIQEHVPNFQKTVNDIKPGNKCLS